ncbi:GNAT family N-acetyltransferase [bacterium]|nr:GNAT family N-acetyltransferase [bacterium]
MAMNCKIRRVKIGDASEIARIQRLAFTEMIGHYFGTDSITKKKTASVIEKLFLLLIKAMKDEIFIAEVDGKIIGNIIVPYDIRKSSRKFPSYRVFWIALVRVLLAMRSVPHENRIALLSDKGTIRRLGKSEIKRQIHSRIYNIAVDPAFQGEGIGYVLMQKGLRYLFNERGANAVTLNVMARNQNAIALYHKFGFVQKERFVNSMGEWIVMVLTRENHLKAERPFSAKKYSPA